MKLTDLVKIDNRFEKSVNLLLDLNNQEKIKLYIPTRSSIKILSEYLSEVINFSGNRADILIGPYGKGKSHLLLVLMAILSGNMTDDVKKFVKKIASMDDEIREKLLIIYGKKKFLPVIINTSSGNLGQAFVRSLNQALKRDGLADIVPDNYFSEAIKTINQWQRLYPETYMALNEKLEGLDVKDLIQRLENFEHNALDQFREIHPLLTSGTNFNPILDDEVLSVYRTVNSAICEKYGYAGMYILFDEFSKYVEGHTEAGFAADMKVLQDICELANSSKNEQLHITCVAHKAISSYSNSFTNEMRNAFRGVEGRLKEIRFIVSSQNNYEIISDAIQKKLSFENWKNNEIYKMMLDESYQIPEFNALFEKKDFDEIIGQGVYPLTPLSSLLLLGLSEKVAQNERTIFTFLTGKDTYSLATYVQKATSVKYVGVDLIYDYFSQLLENEKELFLHNEWLKAEYTLSKTDEEDEQKIIKAIAVIRMMNRMEDIPVNDLFLKLALGVDEKNCKKALNSLIAKKLIVFKRSTAMYEFQNNIGINIENEVSDCAAKYFAKVDIAATLNEVNIKKFILPKKYNQDYLMTRYFKVHIMTEDSFMALTSIFYIKQEYKADGYVIMVLSDIDTNKEVIMKHAAELNSPYAVVGIIEAKKNCADIIREFLAVRKLLSDKNFIEENVVIQIELKALETTLAEELNSWIVERQDSLKQIYANGRIHFVDRLGLNRTISDICEEIYNKTPVINHELINRNNISAQMSKARNTIVDDILHSRLLDKYMKGTSAESTIYRACFIHTVEDKNLIRVNNEITTFLHECTGMKVSFSKLINVLTRPPIGMRKGVIPFYLAKQLMELEDMPTIYYDKKECSIEAKLISDIVAEPEKHYLYIEKETGEKLRYIEELEELFSDYGDYCREIENKNRIAKIKCYIQAWYRSLPQASITFKVSDYENQNIDEIIAFRKLLVGEPNPRELIFEQIPDVFESSNLLSAMRSVKKIKYELDSHISQLKKKAEMAVKKELLLVEDDDFYLSLKAWYENISTKAKESILSTASQRLLNSIKSAVEEKTSIGIIEKLSKATTNFFVEDWTDTTIESFTECFKQLLEEIERKNNSNSTSKQRLSFSVGNDMQECSYDFDSNNLSPSGHFFQCALDDIVEEYGDSVEINEKIGILMKMVKNLMGEM